MEKNVIPQDPTIGDVYIVKKETENSEQIYYTWDIWYSDNQRWLEPFGRILEVIECVDGIPLSQFNDKIEQLQKSIQQ